MSENSPIVSVKCKRVIYCLKLFRVKSKACQFRLISYYCPTENYFLILKLATQFFERCGFFNLLCIDENGIMTINTIKFNYVSKSSTLSRAYNLVKLFYPKYTDPTKEELSSCLYPISI